jgi:hypothetical protein
VGPTLNSSPTFCTSWQQPSSLVLLAAISRGRVHVLAPGLGLALARAAPSVLEPADVASATRLGEARCWQCGLRSVVRCWHCGLPGFVRCWQCRLLVVVVCVASGDGGARSSLRGGARVVRDGGAGRVRALGFNMCLEIGAVGALQLASCRWVQSTPIAQPFECELQFLISATALQVVGLAVVLLMVGSRPLLLSLPSQLVFPVSFPSSPPMGMYCGCDGLTCLVWCRCQQVLR